MYLLLLLLLSVTLWDVRSSKAGDSGCPADATIEIRQLPCPSGSPQVKLECKFTYPGGVISGGIAEDHMLIWSERFQAPPSTITLAGYPGMENPTGKINILNLRVHLDASQQVEDADVDLTEVLGNPPILTSTITIGRSERTRDIKCGVWLWTGDKRHSCETIFTIGGPEQDAEVITSPEQDAEVVTSSEQDAEVVTSSEQDAEVVTSPEQDAEVAAYTL